MRDQIQRKVETELRAALIRGKVCDDGNAVLFHVLLTPEEHEWWGTGTAVAVCADPRLRARLGIDNPSVKLISTSHSYDESKNWKHNFKMVIRC